MITALTETYDEMNGVPCTFVYCLCAAKCRMGILWKSTYSLCVVILSALITFDKIVSDMIASVIRI